MRKEIWVEKTLEVGCLKCQHFSRLVNFQTWIIPDIHPLVFVYKDDETRSSQPDCPNMVRKTLEVEVASKDRQHGTRHLRVLGGGKKSGSFYF